MRNTAICLLAALLGGPPESVGQEPSWSEPGRCGTNCLYALFRFLDFAGIQYEDLAKDIPVDAVRGSSLADLADAASRHGLNTAVRKVSVGQFRSLRPPFIAHLELVDSGGAGHFITVFQFLDIPGTNDKTVRYIDGGSGLMSQQELKHMSPTLTGYVLVVPDHADSWQATIQTTSLSMTTIVTAVLAFPVACVVAWLAVCRKR